MLSSLDRRRAVFVALSLLLCGVAVACSDGVTGPRPSTEETLTRIDRRANYGWSCGSISWEPWGPYDWLIFCFYEAEPETIVGWEPPPSSGDALTTTDYPYCGQNPYACGSSDAGAPNPYTPCQAFFDDTGLPDDGEGLNEDDDANYARFDCRIVKCPPPSVISGDINVSKAALVLLEKQKQTGHEWGAWLYMNPDGTIRVGQFIEGTARSVPAMRYAPDPYVIGSIHSHPPGATWRQSPSDNDKNKALMDNAYVVVASTNGKLYIYPDSPMPGWKTNSPTPSDPPPSCF